MKFKYYPAHVMHYHQIRGDLIVNRFCRDSGVLIIEFGSPCTIRRIDLVHFLAVISYRFDGAYCAEYF